MLFRLICGLSLKKRYMISGIWLYHFHFKFLITGKITSIPARFDLSVDCRSLMITRTIGPLLNSYAPFQPTPWIVFKWSNRYIHNNKRIAWILFFFYFANHTNHALVKHTTSKHRIDNEEMPIDTCVADPTSCCNWFPAEPLITRKESLNSDGYPFH